MAAVAQIPALTAEAEPIPALDPWAKVMSLECSVTVEIPIPNFNVGDLLRLAAGEIVESFWNDAAEVPLSINGHKIADAQFEALGQRLAIRISEVQ